MKVVPLTQTNTKYNNEQKRQAKHNEQEKTRADAFCECNKFYWISNLLTFYGAVTIIYTKHSKIFHKRELSSL